MISSEPHPITDEQARRIAKSITRVIQTVTGQLPAVDEKPVTIADLIRLGCLVFSVANEGFRDDLVKVQNRELLARVFESLHTPEALEHYVYGLLLERPEAAGDVEVASAEAERLMSVPGAGRKALQKAIDEILPKARPGRPTEFTAGSDPDRFLVLSSELNPLCANFLALRERFPKKSDQELFDFLKPESPDRTAILKKHSAFLAEVILRDQEFLELRTAETRAKRLADAVTGKELFNWSYTYSIQRAGEFRRLRETEPDE